VEGRSDVEPPPDVRLYFFAGTQHTAGALPPPPADPNTGGRGRHPFNTVDYAPLLRAALVNLDRWASGASAPPASVVPRVADGTAVGASATAAVFARVPGANFPDRLAAPSRLDFGPDIARGIVSELPPKSGAPFSTLVSAVDADGNEVAGIRPVEVAVPLGTFTGWNPRHPDQGAPGDLMSMMGSTLPFARTGAERDQNGDPRLSIAERYPSQAAYLESAREAAQALVAARHLLEEDVERVVERAARQWDVFDAGLTT
jgi:Alpha/beta hydrolase domain